VADVLLQSQNDHVLTLTLNRPEALNALTQPLMRQLRAALVRAADDPDIRAVVLTGAGAAFCAGGDRKLARVPDPDDPLAQKWQNDPLWESLETRHDRLKGNAQSAMLLHAMPKPTIAMVRGACMGAGLALAAACDFRIASDTAVFQTAFLQAGLSGDFGASYTLTKLVGSARARELFMLNEAVEATQALAMGLVTRVVPDAKLETETAAFTARFAAGPTVAYRYMKRNLNAAETAAFADVLYMESLHMIRATQTEDAQEARTAFKEKRPPRFRGR
jgi:2-(1,2-epoxy-1,2-dihydrophenyl)acetyl-CoA isomerase